MIHYPKHSLFHIPSFPFSIFLLFLLPFFFSCQKIDTEWTPAPPKTEYRLNDVVFVNDSVGYATGGRKFWDDITLKTKNGGLTWDLCAEQISGKAFYAIDFKDAANGIAGGTDGRMYMTSDSGKSWITIQCMWKTFYDIAYINDTTIIAVGGDGYNSGLIMRYSVSTWWTFIDTPKFQLRDVCFVNDSIGYACGYATIMKSHDGGRSWQMTPAKNELFSALSFVNEDIGYAVGRTGTIVKTIDGGESWQTLRSGSSPLNTTLRLNDVHFFSEKVGYIVGDNGVVWKTIDGANTWQHLEKYGKTDFNAIYLWNEHKGIVVGSEGTIVNFVE